MNDRAVRTLEVHRLLFDYSFHLDMNHPEEIVALFTPGCRVAYGPDFAAHGRAEYLTMMRDVCRSFAATSHHVSNIVVDFPAVDRAATVRSAVYAWHRYPDGRPDGHFYGQYHDEVVRVDGRWLFASRELRGAGTIDFHVDHQIPLGRAPSPIEASSGAAGRERKP